MDLTALLGTWINSNPDTHSVARVEATDANGKLRLQVSAVGPGGFVDWGAADAEVALEEQSRPDGVGEAGDQRETGHEGV